MVKQQLNLLAGPPLGAPRRCDTVFPRCLPPADRALGNSEGESGWGLRLDWLRPVQLLGSAGFYARSQ